MGGRQSKNPKEAGTLSEADRIVVMGGDEGDGVQRQTNPGELDGQLR